MSFRSRAVTGMWLLIAARWGCEGGVEGVARPNTPPQTHLAALPPDLTQTQTSVRFYWNGTDPEGMVAYFEWRLSDNGRDGLLSPSDTLGGAWHLTAAGDTTFTVHADLDSFPPDVADPPADPALTRFWRSYALMVRAVDDDGARDPSPELVSFTAVTLAPEAVIVNPVADPQGCRLWKSTPSFRWRATDPDGAMGDMLQARTLLLPLTTCPSAAGFEQLDLLANVPDTQWSDWTRLDAPDGADIQVGYPERRDDGPLLFAVQARDPAGAITPTFRWGVNVILVDVRLDRRPLLTISVDAGTPQRLLSSSAPFLEFDALTQLVAGQPLELEWTTDTTLYGGGLTQTRHGWDVADFGDGADPGWLTPWTDVPARQRILIAALPHLGTSRLAVEARDAAGAVTTVVLRFDQLPLPQG